MLKVKSLLQSMGRFHGGVEIGEPYSGPDSPHAAILIGPWRIIETTLTSPVEERQIIIRIYDRAFQEPREDHEFLLDDLMHEVAEKLGTNFRIGGSNVRALAPVQMTGQPAWQEIGRAAGGVGIWYRTADVLLPIIVDDSYTFAEGT